MTRMLIIALFLILPWTAQAQTPVTPSDDKLEISADTTLEWNRTGSQYIARGNAQAQQGTFSIRADTLTADYRNGKSGQTEIYKLTATGSVIIASDGNRATGDHAVYTVDDGKAVLTGKDVKLEGTSLTITATDRVEYYKTDGRLIAMGAPKVVSGTDTLTADHLTAWLAPQGEKDQRSLKKAEATGNVVITTPTEKATSSRAIYHGDRNVAELLDNVTITRGPNVLNGTRAEMDLTTKVSKMFGSGGTQGRVKGTFFPSSEKSPATPQ